MEAIFRSNYVSARCFKMSPQWHYKTNFCSFSFNHKCFWLPYSLSKRQSLSTTTVLFRSTFTRTIKLNLLLKWLLGSNLSEQRISLNRSSLYRGPVPHILLYIILAILKKIFRYIEWAEPNTYLGRPKLLSSIVNSDGLTLHVPNLIRGEEKY